MKRYDLVIFDVDGTLLDTTEGILEAQKYTIKKMGYEMPSEEELQSFIGPPVQDTYARLYGLEGPILQEIAEIFRNYYSTKSLLGARAYDGIYDLFDKMKEKGVRSAIATYKREDYALTLLRAFHFDRYTDIMYGGDNENKLKKKDIIEKCLKTAGVTDASQVVMIGDTCHDAIGAEKIGADFIGVTFGFGFKSREEVMAAGAVGSADTPAELCELLGL